jgi:hypothetical protein
VAAPTYEILFLEDCFRLRDGRAERFFEVPFWGRQRTDVSPALFAHAPSTTSRSITFWPKSEGPRMTCSFSEFNRWQSSHSL